MKDNISYTDFQKLDFRVGKVISSEKLAGSDNLLRLKVYFGDEIGERQILTGIARWYKPKQLQDKKFVFIINLEAKKMMGEESQGMIFCADDGSRALLIPVSSKIIEGSVVR